MMRGWTQKPGWDPAWLQETTDWYVLCDPHGADINSITDWITDYINFCHDTIIPTRTVYCYMTNKPWITSDLKDLQGITNWRWDWWCVKTHTNRSWRVNFSKTTSKTCGGARSRSQDSTWKTICRGGSLDRANKVQFSTGPLLGHPTQEQSSHPCRH